MEGLLPPRRHIRASAVRHLRGHVNALAQRWVRVDGLAVAVSLRRIHDQQLGNALTAP
jgi:hypothetical protein